MPLGIQPLVDFLEPFFRAFFIAEGFYQLLVGNHFLRKAGQLSLDGGLSPEMLVGIFGDKGGHEQGKGGQHHHQQGYPHIDGQHENQSAQNGDHAGKQLGKTLQKPVGNLVNVVDHPAD